MFDVLDGVLAFFVVVVVVAIAVGITELSEIFLVHRVAITFAWAT
jgi:hypothetical protein